MNDLVEVILIPEAIDRVGVRLPQQVGVDDLVAFEQAHLFEVRQGQFLERYTLYKSYLDKALEFPC